MGMKKAGSTATAPAPAAAAPVATSPVVTAPAAESGTNAAIERLKKKTEIAASAPKSTGRPDYNEEARGKTRCAAFGAALASNYIPGLPVKNIDEYLENVKKAADVMVAYTFGELK